MNDLINLPRVLNSAPGAPALRWRFQTVRGQAPTTAHVRCQYGEMAGLAIRASVHTSAITSGRLTSCEILAVDTFGVSRGPISHRPVMRMANTSMITAETAGVDALATVWAAALREFEATLEQLKNERPEAVRAAMAAHNTRASGSVVIGLHSAYVESMICRALRTRNEVA